MIPAGHLVAREQFLLPWDKETRNKPRKTGTLSLLQSDTILNCIGKDFEVIFDKTTGYITSMTYRGDTLINQGPKTYFWRALTDNDLGNGTHGRSGIWKDAGEKAQLKSLRILSVKEETIELLADYALPDSLGAVQMDYNVYGNGMLLISIFYNPLTNNELPDLLRMGTKMSLPKEFQQVEWYGRGPHESYADRKTSAFIGYYNGTLREQYHPYVRPQETGNKTDVRWLAVRNQDNGVLAVGLPLLSANVLPFPYDSLLSVSSKMRQKHGGEIKPGDEVCLFLDLKQQGVGGDNSWGAPVHREYCIPAIPYTYSFILCPFTPGQNLFNLVREAKNIASLKR